jgi:hypothetical protein
MSYAAGPSGALFVDAGTPESIAFRLMEKILETNPGLTGKEELLKLYAECVATVRGPVADDLLHALSLEG